MENFINPYNEYKPGDLVKCPEVLLFHLGPDNLPLESLNKPMPAISIGMILNKYSSTKIWFRKPWPAKFAMNIEEKPKIILDGEEFRALEWNFIGYTILINEKVFLVGTGIT